MKKLITLLLTSSMFIVTLTSYSSSSAQDPCGSHFHSAIYFEDLQVTESVTRRVLSAGEVMDLLDRLPNVKSVSLPIDPRRPFSIDTLAYPQYADRYALTRQEWLDLQAYCRERLKDPIAINEVISHWRSIAAGTPPFGLRVQK